MNCNVLCPNWRLFLKDRRIERSKNLLDRTLNLVVPLVTPSIVKVLMLKDSPAFPATAVYPAVSCSVILPLWRVFFRFTSCLHSFFQTPSLLNLSLALMLYVPTQADVPDIDFARHFSCNCSVLLILTVFLTNGFGFVAVGFCCFINEDPTRCASMVISSITNNILQDQIGRGFRL